MCHKATIKLIKYAIFTPLLKKVSLDSDDTANFCLISNVSLISKILERLIAECLNVQVVETRTIPIVQSVHRRHHSTETDLTIVSDIDMAADAGDASALALLNLSVAFDTSDHSILFQRLCTYMS